VRRESKGGIPVPKATHPPAPYDEWAEYYDLIHRGLPGEAEFYVGQAVRIGGPALELGCGTGRLSIPMAMSGVAVTGLDNSRRMLDECRAKLRAVGPLKGSLQLVEGDMRAFELPGRYRYIAIAYRTFMHLLEVESQRACLRAVRRHLADDGVCILNVWSARPSAIAAWMAMGRESFYEAGRFPIPGTDRVLIDYGTIRCDEFRQTFQEDHVIHTAGPSGRILRTKRLSIERVWFTPREMEHLLLSCGFEIAALFGDFDCSPFTASSTEMIWVLRGT